MNGARAADGAAVRATIGKRDGTRVAAASLISALSGYLVLVLAARALVPVTENTVFVTFWSSLFACFGVLSGLSMETTRTVAAQSSPAEGATPRSGPRTAVVGAAIGLGAGVVVAALSPWWASAVFPPGRAWLGVLVAVGVVLYAVHSVVVGALAGGRSWVVYSRLIAADGLVRLALVGVSALVGATLAGFAGATVLSAATWAVFVASSRTARSAAATRLASGWGTFVRRAGAASVAAGASAMLVVGFPVLLSVTTPDALYATAAPLLLAISLTRAPLLIPLNAYQGVAVAHFVAHRERGLAAALPALRLVGLVGLAASGAAYLVGPWLMRLVFGPDYGIAGPTLAALTAASALLAVLTLTGALCQALTMHGAFLGGWLVALVVALLLLVVPLPLAGRCILALAGGPAVGAVVHLALLRRRGRGAGR